MFSDEFLHMACMAKAANSTNLEGNKLETAFDEHAARSGPMNVMPSRPSLLRAEGFKTEGIHRGIRQKRLTKITFEAIIVEN